MNNAPNFRETDKSEVVLFYQKNTLNIKERSERIQTCNFLVS